MAGYQSKSLFSPDESFPRNRSRSLLLTLWTLTSVTN